MIKYDLLHERSTNFELYPTQPGLLEINATTLLQIQTFSNSGCVLVLFFAIFTNLFAICYSAKNDDLLLSVRLILTGENVQRLIYTILQMANYLCTIFSNKGCSDDGLTGFFLFNSRSLFVVNAFCQMFISFSRFMAVSFNGMFFKYTTKHTLFQFLLCYSIAISFSCLSMFTNTEIVNMYVTPTLTYFMVTMDFFTFLKLGKMIGNSAYYSMTYFFSSLITIAQYPFVGYSLSNVALQVNSTVSTCIYTLGLSYLNMVYLKKKVSSSSWQNLSAV